MSGLCDLWARVCDFLSQQAVHFTGASVRPTSEEGTLPGRAEDDYTTA